MAQTVKEFVRDAYQLVSANSPTVPLYGDDNNRAIQILDDLIRSYSATGLLTTIAYQVETVLQIGQQFVTFGDASHVPTPDVTFGRLSNLQNAWLLLDGVTYPLIDESRNVFYASYKFDPQQGLPRFCIITNEVDLTRMRVYPSGSQQYQLFVYGKFQLPEFTQNDTMAALPGYYLRYMKFALAKDLAFYKGRASAWTQELKDELKEAKEDMIAASPVNLVIESDHDSLLNGSWRVRAGI
jgi:hypothetical protein